MKDRLKLQSILENILGSRNVYYQAPSRLDYPCIVYDKTQYDIKDADNIKYLKMCRYQIMFISKSIRHDDIVQKILALPYCSFDRHYISDNLHHDTFTLYF